MLLCETRNEARANMPQRPKSSNGRSRPRGAGPRAEEHSHEEGGEWSMANDKSTIHRTASVDHTEDA